MNVFNSFRRFLNRFDLFSILTNRTHFSQSSKIDKNQNQVNCQGHDGKMFKLPKDGGTKKDKTQADQTDPQALQKAKKVLRYKLQYFMRIFSIVYMFCIGIRNAKFYLFSGFLGIGIKAGIFEKSSCINLSKRKSGGPNGSWIVPTK